MSCRRRDGRLTRYERVVLAVHLVLCAGCRFMDRQFAILDLAARKLGYKTSFDSAPDNQRLSPEAREKLKKLIQ